MVKGENQKSVKFCYHIYADTYDDVIQKIVAEFDNSIDAANASLMVNKETISRTAFRNLEKCMTAGRLTTKSLNLCVVEGNNEDLHNSLEQLPDVISVTEHK